MVALLTTLVLLLGCLLTGVVGVPTPMTTTEFEKQGVWGPTAVWYWRCKSPFIIEASYDLESWRPSSVCLEGACCSILADGPLCSKDACGLVAQEPDKPKGMDPLGKTAGRSPKRPPPV